MVAISIFVFCQKSLCGLPGKPSRASCLHIFLKVRGPFWKGLSFHLYHPELFFSRYLWAGTTLEIREMKQRHWDGHSMAHMCIIVMEVSEGGKFGVFHTVQVEICTIKT